MSNVFVSVSMTMDGFIAPEGMDLEHAGDPSHRRWLDRWMQLQEWALRQRFLRENLHLGEGGETGPDNELLEGISRRTGAHIMGKTMFAAGEHSWPENAPFHTPVLVLTHEVREPWERPGGTTFVFVNEGMERALDLAREAAGDRDIRISGGASTIAQYLNAGLVDEVHIAHVPVLFGAGTSLTQPIDRGRVTFQIAETVPSTGVTHLRYRICVA